MGLAESLRTLRELRGWRVVTLARHAAMSADALAEIEAGRPPSPEEGAALERSLGVDLHHLASSSLQEAEDVQPARVFLLHNPGNARFDVADLPVLRDGLRAAREWTLTGGASGLQRRVGVGTSEPEGPNRRDAAHHGYRLAQEVRLLLGEPHAPLGDLRALAEDRLGVIAHTAELHSQRVRATGVLDQSRAAAAITVGEQVSDPATQRFAIAHELCHLLMDPVPGTAAIQISLDQDTRWDRVTDLREARANGFAAELLVPALGVARHVGRARLPSAADAVPFVREVQRAFGCPAQLAINHLCNRDWYSYSVRCDLLERFRAEPSQFDELVAPDQRPSLSPLRARRPQADAVGDPEAAWGAAVAAATARGEERHRWVGATIREAEDLRSSGRPQRGGLVGARATLEAVERGDVQAAADLLERFEVAEWPPPALLGVLGAVGMNRVHLDGAYERLLGRTRQHLSSLPDWPPERVAGALVGA